MKPIQQQLNAYLFKEESKVVEGVLNNISNLQLREDIALAMLVSIKYGEHAYKTEDDVINFFLRGFNDVLLTTLIKHASPVYQELYPDDLPESFTQASQFHVEPKGERSFQGSAEDKNSTI